MTLTGVSATSVTLSGAAFAGSLVPQSNLVGSENPTVAAPSTIFTVASFLGPYEIKGNAIHWPYWATSLVSYPIMPLGSNETIGTYSYTEQLPPLPFETTLCGEAIIVPLPGGGFTVTFPQPCSTAITNPNELVIDITIYNTDFYNSCRVETKRLTPRVHQNIPRISIQRNFKMTPDESVSGVRSSHLGRPLKSGVYSKIPDVCWGTGCFTSDPCK